MSKTEDFLTKQDEQEIVLSIVEAEKNTSGEIRVHIEKQTSMAPIEREEVFMLIPAVVAVPVLLNWAMLHVSHWLLDIFGVQFEFVYQALNAPVFVHAIVEADETAND